MTPAEHHAKAEALLELASLPGRHADVEALLSAAHVHALLAALPQTDDYTVATPARITAAGIHTGGRP